MASRGKQPVPRHCGIYHWIYMFYPSCIPYGMVWSADHMVPTNSKYFKSYNFGDTDHLDASDYEVSHQGYNNAFVLDDPNRLVPVDAMRALEKEGKIGSLLDTYYTTAR